MGARLLGISPETFASAFPFHIIFDHDLMILQVGSALARVCPVVSPGTKVTDSIRLGRPKIEFDVRAFKEHSRSVFVLDVGGGRLSLRGQMIVDDAACTVTFLGSPKVPEGSSLAALGLSLDDFAIHDVTADLYFLHQSKSSTIADVKKLTAELTSQRAELHRANKQLAAQFAITKILTEAGGIEDAMHAILSSLGEALGVSIGAWWEIEQKAEVLRCAEVWRKPGPRLEMFDAGLRGMPLACSVGLPGLVWERGEALRASDTPGEWPLAELATRAKLTDALAFPVAAEREVLGVIGFWSEVELTKDDDLLRLVTDAGVKIGQFVDRRRAEAALRESEERYAIAAEGAKDGLWDWKLASGEVFYSHRWKAMLGYDRQPINDSLEEWFGRVHAADRARVEAELSEHLEGRTEHFEIEHRMEHRDGTYRWMLARGIAVRDEAGNALRMAGTQTDITERKQAELALVAAREELSQKLAVVEQQERAIRKLSTPIIRIWEGVLALPVIGTLDVARAGQMMESLLRELPGAATRVAIIDLTGAERVDRETAEHLVRVMRAARLLGSVCVVAGISPTIAQSFAALDVDMTGFHFFADVKSALADVFQRSDFGVARRPSARR